MKERVSRFGPLRRQKSTVNGCDDEVLNQDWPPVSSKFDLTAQMEEDEQTRLSGCGERTLKR